jgi:SAM-dependent methyltransferase
VELADLRAHWERFGTRDPLWAVLTWPGTRYGRWRREDFLASGRSEIDRASSVVGAVAEEIGVPAPANRALDFGCGVGRLTQALAEHFAEVDGVDIADSMLATARSWNAHGPRVRYHLNATGDLALFPAGRFDFVYTAHVLQHIEPRFVRRYVAEFLRVLADDGLLLIQLVTEPVRGADRPLPDDAFRVELTPQQWPRRLPAGTRQLIEVTVRNTGSSTLPATGTNGWYQVSIGNRWLRPDGALMVGDDARAPLPHDLPPGASARVELEVTAPRGHGRHLLRVDAVQEGVAWFADRGSGPLDAPVSVTSSRWPRGRRADRSRTDHDTADSTMEMHPVSEASARAWIEEAGGTVHRVFDWHEVADHQYTDYERVGMIAGRRSSAPD